MKREDNKSESLAMLPVSSGTKCHHSQVWAACSWRTPYPGQWLQAENHQTNPTTHKTNHFSQNKLCHGEHLSTDTLQKEGRASWDRELKVYWPKQGLRRDAGASATVPKRWAICTCTHSPRHQYGKETKPKQKKPKPHTTTTKHKTPKKQQKKPSKNPN